LFKVQFQNKRLIGVKEGKSDFAQIYPVFCGVCGSMDVEFNYKELEEVRRRIKTKKK